MKLDTSSDPRNVSQSHDLTKPCLVCKKTSHMFDDCEVLQNQDFLKKACIKTCLFYSAVQRAQADIAVQSHCVQLDMPKPDEADFAEVWDNAKDFCQAKLE